MENERTEANIRAKKRILMAFMIILQCNEFDGTYQSDKISSIVRNQMSKINHLNIYLSIPCSLSKWDALEDQQLINLFNFFQHHFFMWCLCQLYNLIMDFIKNHKSFIAAGTALAAGIGIFLYFRSNKGKEEVLLPEVYEADIVSLKSGFTAKIDQIRSRIIGNGVPEEELNNIAQEVAAYVEQRTREVEREDYYKANESRQRNRFNIYVQLILLWQKEKETQIKELIQEQQHMLASFGLSEQQVEQVNRKREAILKERVNTAVDETVIEQARLLLKLKTEYLQTQGDNLVKSILEVCQNWEKESLQHLPNILNVIISESVLSQHKELLNHLLEISWAIDLFSARLDNELAAWDAAISPLFEKIMRELLAE